MSSEIKKPSHAITKTPVKTALHKSFDADSQLSLFSSQSLSPKDHNDAKKLLNREKNSLEVSLRSKSETKIERNAESSPRNCLSPISSSHSLKAKSHLKKLAPVAHAQAGKGLLRAVICNRMFYSLYFVIRWQRVLGQTNE